MKNSLKLFISLIRIFPTPLGETIRKFVYSKLLKECGMNFRVGANTVITDLNTIKIGDHVKISSNSYILSGLQGGELHIGNNCYIGFYSIINASRGQFYIGNDVMIANHVSFEASNHKFERLDLPMNQQGNNIGKIIIEDDVWIGSNCVITANTTIGTGSVIAAGSVVTKDVESFSVMGGVPAKLIKKRG